LFEVIHSAKEPGRIAQRLDTPKWWFKSRHRAGKTTAESPSASRIAAAQHPPEPEVETRRIEPRKPEKRSRFESNGESRSSVKVGFDRARKEFALKFRYTTALMCGFGLFAAVGVAYVVGRHMSSGPQIAAADQVAADQPVRPAVLNVAKSRSAVATATLTNIETPKRTALTNANTVPQKTVVSTLVPASAKTDLPRVDHLNYVVIATYPVEEQAKAETARAFFTKAGIPCSLETCNWAPKLISLVGTAGFAHVRDNDFNTYLANVVKIAKTMKTSQFDRPSPGVYSWKGDPTDHTFSASN
jgi:hypothetical protein